MKIWSDDFVEGGPIPEIHTCDGSDLPPHLAWSDVPAGTRSLALICHDPDAPVGDWVHWMITDLPPDCPGLSRGGPLPQEAREIVNHFGHSRYGGPCPPSGTHRYFFILYALPGDNPTGLDKANFRAKMDEICLNKDQIMGTYGR